MKNKKQNNGLLNRIY